ncbi:hypothetical protein Ocin01_06334 [Orchesella cincta]|uniref:Uncharacterized protein n=1 Tax=Orchesella cincta TaxID=48709 RepID=A0A1D2N5V5_ORCCI|nr:hypothetical protein Ocin01_06334 [Orchesella cincta]
MCCLFSKLDLYENYEDSEEEGKYIQSLSRGKKLQEGIQDISSIILTNISQICPLNQPNYIAFVEKLVSKSLNEIYQPGGGHSEVVEFYEETIPTIQRLLYGCALQLPKITSKALKRAKYPEKVIHLNVFKQPLDISTWLDFRSCIRAKNKTNFYPSVISYVVDTLWQSFLLGYFGCKEHYSSSLEAWKYLHVFQSLIMLPLLQHWNSTFPLLTPVKLQQQEDGSVFYTVAESNVVVPKSSKKVNLSQEDISLKLEKCNVNLFLKYSVDPIPCFQM